MRPRRRTTIDRDRELVEGLRVGDATAPERLVAAYADRAYRLASGITRDARDAEEAVQDAFWAAVRKIATFRGDSAFGSWFYRIVANAAYQKTRARRNRSQELPLQELLPQCADWRPGPTVVDGPLARAELREALTVALDELDANFRTVIVLHDIEGRSSREIAAALHLTVANVKSRVHRARWSLRRRLDGPVSASRRGRATGLVPETEAA